MMFLGVVVYCVRLDTLYVVFVCHNHCYINQIGWVIRKLVSCGGSRLLLVGIVIVLCISGLVLKVVVNSVWAKYRYPIHFL